MRVEETHPPTGPHHILGPHYTRDQVPALPRLPPQGRAQKPSRDVSRPCGRHSVGRGPDAGRWQTETAQAWSRRSWGGKLRRTESPPGSAGREEKGLESARGGGAVPGVLRSGTQQESSAARGDNGVGARRWDGARRRSENAEKTKRGWSVGALGTGMERRQAVGPREGRRTLGRADPSRGMTSSQIQQTRP